VSAGVAQSAEHRFCKPTVVSSTLTASSDLSSWASAFGRRITGGKRDRHRDGSTETGWIPKWLKGPDCKSGGSTFAGSNPAPPIVPRGDGSAGANDDRHPGVRPQLGRFGERHDTLGAASPDPEPPRPEPDYRVPGGCNSMVEYLPSKQATWVRFPSPALSGVAIVARRRNQGWPLQVRGGIDATTTIDRLLKIKCCRGSVGRARPW
jgi:hypothetical protein